MNKSMMNKSMNKDQIIDFCIKHAENVSQEVREKIYETILIHVDKNNIAGNNDGVRIHVANIPDKCIMEIYDIIKTYLE